MRYLHRLPLRFGAAAAAATLIPASAAPLASACPSDISWPVSTSTHDTRGVIVSAVAPPRPHRSEVKYRNFAGNASADQKRTHYASGVALINRQFKNCCSTPRGVRWMVRTESTRENSGPNWAANAAAS